MTHELNLDLTETPCRECPLAQNMVSDYRALTENIGFAKELLQEVEESLQKNQMDELRTTMRHAELAAEARAKFTEAIDNRPPGLILTDEQIEQMYTAIDQAIVEDVTDVVFGLLRDLPAIGLLNSAGKVFDDYAEGGNPEEAERRLDMLEELGQRREKLLVEWAEGEAPMERRLREMDRQVGAIKTELTAITDQLRALGLRLCGITVEYNQDGKVDPQSITPKRIYEGIAKLREAREEKRQKIIAQLTSCHGPLLTRSWWGLKRTKTCSAQQDACGLKALPT